MAPWKCLIGLAWIAVGSRAATATTVWQKTERKTKSGQQGSTLRSVLTVTENLTCATSAEGSSGHVNRRGASLIGSHQKNHQSNRTEKSAATRPAVITKIVGAIGAKERSSDIEASDQLFDNEPMTSGLTRAGRIGYVSCARWAKSVTASGLNCTRATTVATTATPRRKHSH